MKRRQPGRGDLFTTLVRCVRLASRVAESIPDHGIDAGIDTLNLRDVHLDRFERRDRSFANVSGQLDARHREQ